MLQPFCSEFLIHAADNEGLQKGIDPVTYAGGGRALEDLADVERLSQGRVDLTIGSALDIFGGKSVRFQDCVDWNTLRRRCS